MSEAITFTYNPAQCQDGGMNQMRFELGDTIVDMEGISAALSDQEYTAIIGAYGVKKWRYAKYKCLEAIMMKLSFEVDTSVGGLSYSLSQRFDRWKELFEEEKKQILAMQSVPLVGDESSLIPHGLTRTPYYHNDMLANKRKF
jgi:hypothetical protein